MRQKIIVKADISNSESTGLGSNVRLFCYSLRMVWKQRILDNMTLSPKRNTTQCIYYEQHGHLDSSEGNLLLSTDGRDNLGLAYKVLNKGVEFILADVNILLFYMDTNDLLKEKAIMTDSSRGRTKICKFATVISVWLGITCHSQTLMFNVSGILGIIFFFSRIGPVMQTWDDKSNVVSRWQVVSKSDCITQNLAAHDTGIKPNSCTDKFTIFFSKTCRKYKLK